MRCPVVFTELRIDNAAGCPLDSIKTLGDDQVEYRMSLASYLKRVLNAMALYGHISTLMGECFSIGCVHDRVSDRPQHSLPTSSA